jgi:gamma-glutamyl:cysteine ligase YbdK (ATP-grasp superfamily)
VEIPDIETAQQDIKLRVGKELSPLIKEHLQIEQEILSLEEQDCKVNDLADLVSTSELYSSQLELYEKALVQIEKLLKKARQLQNIYIHLIREGLIGIQVAGYNPDTIQNDRLAFDSKYRRIREEYQYMKDLATAYTELLRQQSE